MDVYVLMNHSTRPGFEFFEALEAFSNEEDAKAALEKNLDEFLKMCENGDEPGMADCEVTVKEPTEWMVEGDYGAWKTYYEKMYIAKLKLNG